MAFSDLKASLVAFGGILDNIDKDVAGLQAAVDDLKAQIAVGMTPEQVTEAQALADQIKSKAQAIADRTPDAPVEEPPAV